MVLLESTLLVHVEKEKSLVSQRLTRDFKYPDPGSNRDGLPHWCLRPARLPIPPSGHGCCLNNGCKGREKIWIWQIFEELFNDITLNNAYL